MKKYTWKYFKNKPKLKFTTRDVLVQAIALAEQHNEILKKLYGV